MSNGPLGSFELHADSPQHLDGAVGEDGCRATRSISKALAPLRFLPETSMMEAIFANRKALVKYLP